MDSNGKRTSHMQGDNRKSTRHARIEKSTYYARLKYLEIDPTKDAEGTYLNAEQIKLMNL